MSIGNNKYYYSGGLLSDLIFIQIQLVLHEHWGLSETLFVY